MRKLPIIKIALLTVLTLFAASASLFAASAYPFPINQNYAHGIRITNANTTTMLSMYNTWKSRYVVTAGVGQRVISPEPIMNQNNTTVSEGQSYGMLLALYFDDKTLFDNLWRFKVDRTNASGKASNLMPWVIGSNGSTILDPNSASDADYDIAWAMLMAEIQWGNAGTFNYGTLSRTEIQRCRQYTLEAGTYEVRPGDNWNNWYYPSYFYPSYFREFAEVDTVGAAAWNGATARCATAMANNRNTTSGLVGEICNRDGTRRTDNPCGSGCDGRIYKYNSCRVPFRYAMDYVWWGPSVTNPSTTQVQLMARFFGGDPTVPNSVANAASVRDGYWISNSTVQDNNNNAAFVGPAACALMFSSTYSAKLTDYYDRTRAFSVTESYYNGSLQLLSLLLVTGNFHNLRKLGPALPTPTPTTPPTAQLLDDFEDYAPYLDTQNNWGGYWFTWADPPSGSVTVWPAANSHVTMTAGGPTGSTYHLRITGQKAAAIPASNYYPSVGVGTDLVENAVATNGYVDVRAFQTAGGGLMFDARGDGVTPYKIVLSPYNYAVLHPDWAMFEYEFIPPATWTHYEILFTEFLKPTWGTNTTTITTVLGQLQQLKWQVATNNAVASIDFRLDNVAFFPYMWTPTPEPTPSYTRTFTRTPSATITPTFGASQLLDDCEDGDGTNNWGGPWFTYNDAANSGTSYIVPVPGGIFAMASPGAASTSYAVNVTGYVTDAYEYGFIGVGTGTNANSPTGTGINISTALGIRFWIKGNNIPISVKLIPGTGVNDGDDHYQTQITATDTWTQHQLFFSDFKQEGWGTAVTLAAVKNNLAAFHWQTVHNPWASIDLWIDQVEVFPVLWTPTNTPSRTRTPTPTFTNTAPPTSTFTGTRTRTQTYTPTLTNTPPPPTSTFTGTPTRSATPTASGTRSATQTNTPVPPSPTNTATRTFTGTMTSTPTHTGTSTGTSTLTVTPTFTISNTHTVSPTETEFAGSPTNTFTHTNTPTRTPTGTNTNTFTPTYTGTYTATPTVTMTNTIGNSPTSTATNTIVVESATHTPTTDIPVNTATFTHTTVIPDTPTGTPTTDIPVNTMTNTPTTDIPVNTPTNTPTTDIPVNTMTNTPTIDIPVNTPTPTNTAQTSSSIFDDMADCNNQSNWGGYWYTYNDHDAPNSGDSAIWPPSENMVPGAEFIMSAPGRLGAGDCAARLTGNVTTTYTYGFIGMGVGILPPPALPTDPKPTFDFSSCGGVRFYARGDGKSYSVKLKAADTIITGSNDYKYNFMTDTGWVQYDVPMALFTQESGWGTVVPKATILASITDIQFQTVGQPHTSIDLWVDDFEFYGCTSYPPPVSGAETPTPVATNTPVVPTATFTITNTPTMTDTPIPGATDTPTPLPTNTEVPTNTPAAGAGMMDDMADCDNATNWGSYWYTYNDHDAPNNGDSAIWPSSENMVPGAEFIMSAPGRLGAGDCAARLTGNVTTTYQYGFIGMGSGILPPGALPTDPKPTYDFSSCSGIRFYAKGDGKPYSVKLKAADSVNTGFNDYKYNFITGSDWVQYDVPMTLFTQESGWGTAVDRSIVLASITDIQFQTVGQPHASIDLWVDDFEFYGCTSYPPAIGGGTPVPTNTPPAGATETFTATPPMGATPTFTATPPQAEPTEGRILEIPTQTPVIAFPNPAVLADGSIAPEIGIQFGLTKKAYAVIFKMYSPSMRLIRQKEIRDTEANLNAGLRTIRVPSEILKGLSAGTYYYTVEAFAEGGVTARSGVNKIRILKPVQ